jgi:hypothetical protein
VIPELTGRHGDRAVGKLLDVRGPDVVAVPVPLDVDTEDEHRRVPALAGEAG